MSKKPKPVLDIDGAPITSLTDAETEEIILAIARGSTEPLTVDQLRQRAERVTAWATSVRRQQAMLALILRGEIDIAVPANSAEPLELKPRQGAH